MTGLVPALFGFYWDLARGQASLSLVAFLSKRPQPEPGSTGVRVGLSQLISTDLTGTQPIVGSVPHISPRVSTGLRADKWLRLNSVQL